MIELIDVHKSFGKQVVLDGVNFSVETGETVALLGPSGTGKSVLLKHIVGLLRPDRGEVWFEGRRVDTMTESQLAKMREKFGFLFQMGALFDSMTVRDNIAFPLAEHTGMSRTEQKDRVAQALKMVGLPNIDKKMPAELSGGQRKRVALARAIVLEPAVVLYDEPTTGLDPIMSDVINELMLSTRRNYQVTGLVVTHDMHTARKVAERVIMLYPLSRLGPGEPQIVFDGPPEELDRASDRRVRQFVRGEAGERLMEMREQAETAGSEVT